MKMLRARRWFAVGLSGALFALMAAVSIAPVAADGLVTPYPGQDPNAPIQVVGSPGFVQSGAAAIPGSSTTINGQTVLVNGQYYYVGQNGAYVPYYPGQGYYPGFGYGGYGYGYGANCAYGTCGYTAAGPVVGVDGNGSTLVYDVRGGTIDAYTRDGNGRVCEADSNGACMKNSNTQP